MKRTCTAVIALMGIVSTRHQAQVQNAGENVKLIQALPTPSGTMSIGRRHYEWLDPSRKSSTGGSRVVVVSIFYPSANRAAVYGEYVEGAGKLPSNERTRFLRDSFGPAWQFVATDKLRSHAQDNVQILKTGKKLPVLLFSPGLGMVSAAYSVQLEDLASHGYVVVAIDHPYDSPLLALSDGTLIPFDQKTWSEHQPPGPPTLGGMKFANQRQEDWVADSTFVLRELRSRSNAPFFNSLDLAHIGAFGHSFGGVVAAKLCQTESLVQACINEDGEMSGKTLTPDESASPLNPTLPVRRPLLVFTLVEPGMKGNPYYMQLRKARQDDLLTFLHTKTTRSYLIVIDRPEIGHKSFSDIPFFYDNGSRTGSLQLTEFTRDVAVAFFDQFLKGKHSSRLDKVLSENQVGTVAVFAH